MRAYKELNSKEKRELRFKKLLTKSGRGGYWVPHDTTYMENWGEVHYKVLGTEPIIYSIGRHWPFRKLNNLPQDFVDSRFAEELIKDVENKYRWRHTRNGYVKNEK